MLNQRTRSCLLIMNFETFQRPSTMNMNMNVLKVLKQEGGILPTRAHNTDAGWDLYTPKTFTLMPHEKMCIDIKIAITVPYGTYGRIAPRSGLAYKHGVDVLAGVIDHQYTNNIVSSSPDWRPGNGGVREVKEIEMSSGTAKPVSATERLHYCSEHKSACEQCSECETYSYCPECCKCYEPTCPDS